MRQVNKKRQFVPTTTIRVTKTLNKKSDEIFKRHKEACKKNKKPTPFKADWDEQIYQIGLAHIQIGLEQQCLL